VNSLLNVVSVLQGGGATAPAPLMQPAPGVPPLRGPVHTAPAPGGYGNHSLPPLQAPPGPSLHSPAPPVAGVPPAGPGGKPLVDPQVAAQVEVETLTEGVKMFTERYPIDQRAYEYLTTAPATVLLHVLRDFRPPREGDPDYSGLLTTYVKKTRQLYGPGPPALSPQAAPAAPGTATAPAQSDEFIDLMENGAPRPSAWLAFVKKYPVDDRAFNFLTTAPPAVQLRVLKEFRPQRSGEADYSALLTTFTKKCMDQMHGQGAPLVSASRPTLIIPNGQAQIPVDAPVPPDLNTAMSTPGLDFFIQKYPIDERAYDFFAQSPTEVQARVLTGFKPNREGEANYSGLFTSFVKKMRSQVGIYDGSSAGSGAGGYGPPQVLVGGRQGHHDSWGPAQHGYDQQHYDQQNDDGADDILQKFIDDMSEQERADAGVSHTAMGASATSSGPPEQLLTDEEQILLEGFRLKFPMDDRAFDFVKTSPPEVRERIVESFAPSRPDDTDYSAPITAYVRSLRKSADQAYAPGGATVSDEEVKGFFERYPCDVRAMDFFNISTPEVQAQVVREFRPRSEGDSDYSAVLTSYIKRCRQDRDPYPGRPRFVGGYGPPQGQALQPLQGAYPAPAMQAYPFAPAAKRPRFA